ncbi:MAG: hypothetical protein OXU20_25535 [Myxococcales bacterium]|nr:hypothetical protein [Myxococcales bacterium]MDD9968465.1 hypothetical protein [Myxococcales bacterium]
MTIERHACRGRYALVTLLLVVGALSAPRVLAVPLAADSQSAPAGPRSSPSHPLRAPAGAPNVQALPNLRLDAKGFLGGSDALMLDRLIQGRVERIKKGSGGRSLGFKLSFADGTRGYFKPAQSFSGAIWYAEVAAYHLDRMLGMGRVPPVVSYRMPWRPLEAAAGSDRRREEVQANADGTVDGALVYWLPEKLEPAKTPPGWENWLRITPFERWRVTPYQRPAAYTRALEQQRTRRKEGAGATSHYDEVPDLHDPGLAAALSDMLVLDFLTLNIDRWGGRNGNVLSYGNDRPSLIFLDNGAGFSDGPHRRGLMEDRLEVQQRFRRATVEALRGFRISAFEARLAGEALAPVLNPHLLAGIEVRRKALLAHVDGLIAKHGEAQVLAWP